VIDAINTATGGAVVASVAAGSNGVTLTDTTGGGGAVSVAALNTRWPRAIWASISGGRRGYQRPRCHRVDQQRAALQPARRQWTIARTVDFTHRNRRRASDA